jgi:hypothetical protein
VDGHKIWICHSTSSLSNPYVKILIDIAAWNVSDPDSNDHGTGHHLRAKNGIVWGDYAVADPDDECTLDTPPPPLLCPDGNPADYVVAFDGTKLTPRGPLTQTVAINLPAGAYDVTLISGDFDRGERDGNPLFQPNERWRLLGSTPSGYSDDLPDTLDDISGQATTGLSVVFKKDATSVTAEHWSADTGDDHMNSVVPQYSCLTAAAARRTAAAYTDVNRANPRYPIPGVRRSRISGITCSASRERNE